MALNEREYSFWFCSLSRLTARTKSRLKEAFGGEEELYRASEKAVKEVLQSIPRVRTRERIWEMLLESRDEERIRRAYDRLEQTGIRLVTREDPEFPEKLEGIVDCPSGLFVKGRLPDPKRPAAAVVGSRSCSFYGRTAARELGRTLAKAGVQVISGLALGIDAAGHRGALDSCGRTFGVLGCGPDQIYPRENESLFGRVAEAGGLISEYPPGVGPEAWHFPARNRIISGLSDSIAVVEAGKKSGSLITASYALEQGKDIWAVPGRMGEYLSQGTNMLIRDGAFLLTEPEDMLMSWNLTGKRNFEKIKLSLDKNEEKVYSCLDSDPKSEERLCEERGLDSAVVAAVLVDLELEGLAVQPFRHYYTAKRDKGE